MASVVVASGGEWKRMLARSPLIGVFLVVATGCATSFSEPVPPLVDVVMTLDGEHLSGVVDWIDVSRDGRIVVFATASTNLPGCPEGCSVFVVNRSTGERVESCGVPDAADVLIEDGTGFVGFQGDVARRLEFESCEIVDLPTPGRSSDVGRWALFRDGSGFAWLDRERGEVRFGSFDTDATAPIALPIEPGASVERWSIDASRHGRGLLVWAEVMLDGLRVEHFWLVDVAVPSVAPLPRLDALGRDPQAPFGIFSDDEEDVFLLPERQQPRWWRRGASGYHFGSFIGTTARGIADDDRLYANGDGSNCIDGTVVPGASGACEIRLDGTPRAVLAMVPDGYSHARVWVVAPESHELVGFFPIVDEEEIGGRVAAVSLDRGEAP